MANNFLWEVQRAPQEAPGHDMAALGPSNSSDSGSDIAGLVLEDDDPLSGELEAQPGGLLSETPFSPSSDTDGDGTGERRGAFSGEDGTEAFDISPDRIIHITDVNGGEGQEEEGEGEEEEPRPV